ncbi:MAG: molybdenum cofactor biosynthesis protein MoaE [Deltaproteobacteria bacterium]|nr:molybdenum cofactor biosynthesis protein MoaE [Deltaproteobacteria bacterium]
MIEITEYPLSPESVIAKVRSSNCGCVVTYIGLIRDCSEGKPVLSVEYRDPQEVAEAQLQKIADMVKRQWPISNIAISHRTGILNVGEINLVIAVASAHREAAFNACQYTVDQFKQRLPTTKKETYRDSYQEYPASAPAGDR